MQSALIEELLHTKAPEQVKDFDDFDEPKRHGRKDSGLDIDEFRRRPASKRKSALNELIGSKPEKLKSARKRAASLENEDEYFMETAGLNVKRYAAKPRRKQVKSSVQTAKFDDDSASDSAGGADMDVDDDQVEPIVPLSKRAIPKSVSLIDDANEVPKSEEQEASAVRAQFELFDALLELRIGLHTLNSLVNTLPQPTTFDHFVTLTKQNEADARRIVVVANDSTATTGQRDESEQSTTLWRLSNARRTFTALIHKLMLVDETLSEHDAAKRELPDADDLGAAGETDADRDRLLALMGLFENALNERLDVYRADRDTVMTKWQQRTRLASAFGKFERAVSDQIVAYSNDPQSIQKTRLKRSAFRVLGSAVDDAGRPLNGIEGGSRQTDADGELPFRVGADELLATNPRRNDSGGRQYDSEIFDDDDFYQKQIREFLALSALAATEGDDGRESHAALLGELDAVKRRRKVKQVDTRASKARRLRFTVHPKLVNFLAPVSGASAISRSRQTAIEENDQYAEWTDERRQALFSALFRSQSDADC